MLLVPPLAPRDRHAGGLGRGRATGHLVDRAARVLYAVDGQAAALHPALPGPDGHSHRARGPWRREAVRHDALLTTAGALTGVTLLAVAALAYRLSPILSGADPAWTPLGPALLAASGVAIIVGSMGLRGGAKTATWLAAAAVAAVAVEATVYWPSRPEPVERIAAAIAAQSPQQPVCSCNAFTRNLGFYAHVRTVVRDSEPDIRAYLAATPQALAVVDEGTLSRFEADTGRTLTRLLTVPYLDTARLRVGDLLRDPDPAKVRSIVLVRTP